MTEIEDYSARFARERAEAEATARTKLSELLQPEWRTVRADYQGGGDQGELTGVYVSKHAYNEDNIDELEAGYVPEGDGWHGLEETLDGHAMVDGKWAKIEVDRSDAQVWANAVYDHVWPLVSRKWGGFAFEGNVTGLIVFDAETQVVIRQDQVAMTEYETETETF